MTNSILRLPEVMNRTGLSRSSIYSFIALGLFPAPVKLGVRAVGWWGSDIDLWIRTRIKTAEGDHVGQVTPK